MRGRPEARPSRPRPARLEGYDRLIADLRGTGSAGGRDPRGWPGSPGMTNGFAGAGPAPDVPDVAAPPRSSRAPRSGSPEAVRRSPARPSALSEAATTTHPKPAPAPGPATGSWVSRWEAAVEDGCDEDELTVVLEHCREQAYVFGDVAWRAALTLLLARTGRLDEARRELVATEAAAAENGVDAAWIDVPASLGRAKRLLGAAPAPPSRPRKGARLRALSGSAPAPPVPAPVVPEAPESPRRSRSARDSWTSWEEPA